MTIEHLQECFSVVAVAIVMVLVGVSGAQTAPVKLLLAGSFGREVNLTEVEKHGGPKLEDICTVPSKDGCQPGKPSSIAGGFAYPEDMARV